MAGVRAEFRNGVVLLRGLYAFGDDGFWSPWANWMVALTVTWLFGSAARVGMNYVDLDRVDPEVVQPAKRGVPGSPKLSPKAREGLLEVTMIKARS